MERGPQPSLHLKPSTPLCQASAVTAYRAADSGVNPGVAADAAVVCAVAVAHVSETTAAFVAGAFVPSAASASRWPVAVPVADGHAPVSVAASRDPAVACCTTSPVAAGISGRGFGRRCFAIADASEQKVHSHELRGQTARRNSSPAEADRIAPPL